MKLFMLNSRQKEMLAQRLAELGNIAIGSLVFGFVLRSDAFNNFSLLLGLAVAIVMYASAIILAR